MSDHQGQRFRPHGRGQGGHRKEETPSSTDTFINSTTLDFIHGDDGTAQNRLPILPHSEKINIYYKEGRVRASCGSPAIDERRHPEHGTSSSLRHGVGSAVL